MALSLESNNSIPKTDICPTSKQLVERIEERLTVANRTLVDSHVEQCKACQDRLGSLVDSLYPNHDFSSVSTSNRIDTIDQCNAGNNVLARVQESVLPKPELDRNYSDQMRRDERSMPLVGIAGEGGMAVVFRCRDETTGTDVAVKVMRHHYAANPEAKEQFQRESQIQSRLATHPGVADVFETGELSDGRLYTMMEYCKGQTLSQRMKVTNAPCSPPNEMVSIFQRVCEVVAHAHKQGIRHRDLKPSNIHVNASGDVKILDWGLAQDASSAIRKDILATEPRDFEDSISGTPGYIAPERIRNVTAEASSDVYSLGVILSELLTGRRIGWRDSAIIDEKEQQRTRLEILKHVQSSSLKKKMADLITRCLAANPADRPQDAGELLAELERANTSEVSYLSGKRSYSPARHLVSPSQ